MITKHNQHFPPELHELANVGHQKHTFKLAQNNLGQQHNLTWQHIGQQCVVETTTLLAQNKLGNSTYNHNDSQHNLVGGCELHRQETHPNNETPSLRQLTPKNYCLCPSKLKLIKLWCHIYSFGVQHLCKHSIDALGSRSHDMIQGSKRTIIPA